jgi:virulence factor
MSEPRITRRSLLAMPLALQLGVACRGSFGGESREGRNMSKSSMLRIGAVGIDNSHLTAFTQKINALNDSGKTRCRVTHLWHDGDPDTTEDRWRKFHSESLAMGLEESPSLESLVESVDAVMINAVNGHKHRAFATAALERGRPTYIDKPLACSLDDARAILELSRKNNVPCYSASSLRFAAELDRIDRKATGELVAIDAFGPGSHHPKMEGLFFYGVHVVEMVDAIWGPGVKRISAISLADRDLADLEYRDGRYARLRLERKASGSFGATVHGDKGVRQFVVDSAQIYVNLIQKLTHFYETGEAPVPLRDLVENVAVMEAGNRSMKQDGAWVDVPDIA